jgi:hypothetical protein
MKTEIIKGWPSETYHAAPGLSHSMLRNIDPTPADYLEYVTNGVETTPAMILGTLTHSLILEPSIPLPRISIKPADLRANSAAFKAWKAEQGSNLIIGQDAWDTLMGMVRSVSTHPYARKVLSVGETEISLFHTRDGVLRKARIDFAPHGNFLCDVKTCQDSGPVGFAKTIGEFSYFSQAAWYLDMWNDTHPEDQREGFMFVAVDKSAPYKVACHFLDPDDIELGRTVNHRRLIKWIECVEKNQWPGWSETFYQTRIPSWIRVKMEET